MEKYSLKTDAYIEKSQAFNKRFKQPLEWVAEGRSRHWKYEKK